MEPKKVDQEMVKVQIDQSSESQIIDCFVLNDRKLIFFTQETYIIYNSQFQELKQIELEFPLQCCHESNMSGESGFWLVQRKVGIPSKFGSSRDREIDC